MRAVPGGCLLLRHLITLASTVAHLHYWIHLNAEANANITWWWTFLPTRNGTAKFIDWNSVLDEDICSCTQTPLALITVVPTTKVPGSSTLGDHTNTFSRSVGKSCSLLWQQLSLIPRLLCRGGGNTAWYTLFAHVPSFLGKLHTKITFNLCLPAERPHCTVILPVGHIVLLKSNTISL